ncbi:MAG: hypothetical protein M3Q69_18180, partial [Acidobacteriota bacterium]|nr:hypothetical protein [Acidobacteriota bacterium]
ERIEHMAAVRDMQDYAEAVASCQLPVASDEPSRVIDRVKRRWPGVFQKSPLPEIGNWQLATGNGLPATDQRPTNSQ